jgi:hypothetical protein
LHYLHNNVLVIDQSEYIEDRPVPGPFPAFPMTKREKPWERGCVNCSLLRSQRGSGIAETELRKLDCRAAWGIKIGIGDKTQNGGNTYVL